MSIPSFKNLTIEEVHPRPMPSNVRRACT